MWIVVSCCGGKYLAFCAYVERQQGVKKRKQACGPTNRDVIAAERGSVMDRYKCPKCGLEMTAVVWWSLGSVGKCPAGCGEYIDGFTRIDGPDKEVSNIDGMIDRVQKILDKTVNMKSAEEQCEFLEMLNETQQAMADNFNDPLAPYESEDEISYGKGIPELLRLTEDELNKAMVPGGRERAKGSRLAEKLVAHGLAMLSKKGMIPVTMIHDGLLVTGKVTFEIDEKEEVLR